MEEQRGRRSVRLKGYEYAATGGYFLTVVTRGRECPFGEIVNGEMRLSRLGEIVREEWFQTGVLRPYVRLEEHEFVVMPNHTHGIIWILGDAVVGARRRRAPTPRFGKPIAGSLPNIVRSFKAAVTYRAGRELDLANIWQRNYYEHIIRKQADYERIAKYIATNPSQWDKDEENPQQKRP